MTPLGGAGAAGFARRPTRPSARRRAGDCRPRRRAPPTATGADRAAARAADRADRAAARAADRADRAAAGPTRGNRARGARRRRRREPRERVLGLGLARARVGGAAAVSRRAADDAAAPLLVRRRGSGETPRSGYWSSRALAQREGDAAATVLGYAPRARARAAGASRSSSG